MKVGRVGCLLWLLPLLARAQGTIVVSPASASVLRAEPDAKLAMPVAVDMSEAEGANLSTFRTGVTWNAQRLTLDSAQAAFPAPTADLANRASGVASLTFAGAGGNRQALATLHFTTQATTGGATIQLQPTVATNEHGVDILPVVRSRLLDVCVAPSWQWGVVNRNSSVHR